MRAWRNDRKRVELHLGNVPFVGEARELYLYSIQLARLAAATKSFMRMVMPLEKYARMSHVFNA